MELEVKLKRKYESKTETLILLIIKETCEDVST